MSAPLLREYRSTLPHEFRKALLRDGAVMLRGAADPELLDEIHRQLDRFFAEYGKIQSSDFERNMASDDPNERDFWQQLKLGHVYDRTFKPFSGISYFDVIRSNGLWDLVARAFHESPLTESATTNCRRMTMDDLPRFYDRPLEFHVDAQIFGVHQLSINFWTPLMACGVHAPGVKIIQLGVQETKEYLEFNEAGHEPAEGDQWHMSKFRCHKMTLPVLQANGLLERVQLPSFDKGDILAFTNFTMHGSHFVPSMTEPRTSIEIRVDLPAFPIHAPQAKAAEPAGAAMLAN